MTKTNAKVWLELDIAILMEELVTRTPHERDTPIFRKSMETEIRDHHRADWSVETRERWLEAKITLLIEKFALNPHPHPIY